MGYEGYLSDRLLMSRDALNKKQIKIKIVEQDERNRDFSKNGDRVLIKKILLIVQHLETEEIEEIELDIENLENRMKKERLFSSSNRWVPQIDIRNNFVSGSRHTYLLSDAIALDIVSF